MSAIGLGFATGAIPNCVFLAPRGWGLRRPRGRRERAIGSSVGGWRIRKRKDSYETKFQGSRRLDAEDLSANPGNQPALRGHLPPGAGALAGPGVSTGLR